MGDAPSVVSIHTTPRRARDGVNKPRLRVSASVLQGRRRKNMSETPARYCGNCGNELDPEDQFCQNCGRPVHRTASVPTPEADVPVPPPPQREEGIAASPPQQDQSTDIKEWWQTPIGKTIGILTAIVAILIILVTIVVNLAGGEETGSQENKAKIEPGAPKAQEPGSGGGKDTTPKP